MAIAPGLHRIRDPADQVDLEQPVIATGAFNLDVVGQAELALKGPSGDTFEKVFLVLAVGLLAGHRQQVLLGDDLQILGSKARDRERNPEAVAVGPDDVVGRVGIVGFGEVSIVDEIKQPVEADAGTSQGSKVVSPHFHILRLSNMNTKKPGGRPTPRRTRKASDDAFFIFWILDFQEGVSKKISALTNGFDQPPQTDWQRIPRLHRDCGSDIKKRSRQGPLPSPRLLRLFTVLLHVLSHFEMVLQLGQGFARPVLQLRILPALGVALEQ